MASLQDFDNLDPAALRRYIGTQREGRYELIDVRQPHEYAAGHIPGARPLPLPQLEARLFELPGDRDLVFYCHSGARSQAAAMLAALGEVTQGRVLNLESGILGWDGAMLDGTPRIELLRPDEPWPRRLHAAMDLEKGAWRFYTAVCRRYPQAPWIAVMHELSLAETAHARVLHGFLSQLDPELPDFQPLYEGLKGEILEGGMPLQQALDQVAAAGADGCLPIMELALRIEYAAFDLYRTMADTVSEPEARQALLAIAQSEKAHLRTLIGALPNCAVSDASTPQP